MDIKQFVKSYKEYQLNFELFSKKALVIRSQSYGLQNFHLNHEQLLINSVLDRQMKQRGRIKSIILKGRQIGSTTLIAAKNYHFNLFNKGVKSLVLAHTQRATNNIFSIMERYYKNSPFY